MIVLPRKGPSRRGLGCLAAGAAPDGLSRRPRRSGAVPRRRIPGARQGRHGLDADLDRARADDVGPWPRPVLRRPRAHQEHAVGADAGLHDRVARGDHLGASTAIRSPSRTGRTGHRRFIGGFDKAFLRGVTPASTAATFSNGVVIPEYAYMAFQMTFACITPALIVGAFAERMKFSALVVFVHAVDHPDLFPHRPFGLVLGRARTRSATPPRRWQRARAMPPRRPLRPSSTRSRADAGYFNQLGALDFAGGTVVHINAGIAGLVGALMLGKRIGYPREPMPPHSLTMTMIGASLLWVGWFGFNAGSNLEANGDDGAGLRQHLRGHRRRDPRLAVRGMGHQGQAFAARHVLGGGRRPRRGDAGFGLCGPMGAIVLGLVVGVVCFFFVVRRQEQDRLRRFARRLRRALHRRDHRRHRHRHSRGAGARRRRPDRLYAEAGDGRAGTLRDGDAGADPVQDGGLHACSGRALVRRSSTSSST